MNNVIPCGTRVVIKPANIEGTITGISLRFEAIAYEISYFNRDLEHREVWLNACMFEIKELDILKIGFVK